MSHFQLRIVILFLFLTIFLGITNSILAFGRRHSTNIPYIIWTWIWSCILTCILFWDHMKSLWGKGKLQTDPIGILAAVVLIVLMHVLPEYFWPNKVVISVTVPLIWIILLHSFTKSPPSEPD